MKMKNITDFLKENKDTIFRYLVLNKYNIWTPEQQEKKYCDESIYTNIHYEFAKITDAINTPDGLLLELTQVDPDNPVTKYHIEYKLLKDIELSKFDVDNQKEELFDDEEEEPF